MTEFLDPSELSCIFFVLILRGLCYKLTLDKFSFLLLLSTAESDQDFQGP